MTNLMKFDNSKDVPRIRDVDLGRFLGMEKPANIRQSIAKYLRDGKLNDYDVITQRVTEERLAGTVFRDSKKPAAEYWLTEEGALFVASRSDSKRGTEVLRALIAAFDELRRQNGVVSRMLTHYFNELPAKLKDRLFPDLIRALLKLRKEQQIGNPAWGPMLASLVYGWSLKAHGQQEHRRRLNPTPNGSKTDYTWLTGEGLEACRRVIQTGVDLARACDSYADWKYRMELIFGDKAVQLQLANPFSSAPKLPPKKRGKPERRPEA